MNTSVFSKLFVSYGITLCGLLLIIFLIVVYYSKKRSNEFSHRMYRMLLIVALIAMIFNYLYFLGAADVSIFGPLKEYLIRIFLLFGILWSNTFLLYLLATFYIKDFKTKLGKIIIGGTYFISIVTWVISCFAQAEFETSTIYTMGGSIVLYLYVAVAIPFILYVITYFVKFKSMNKIQRLLLALVLIIFIGIMLIKSKTGYEMNYILYYLVVFLYTFYFTYESQAYLMSLEINELKNKTKLLNENKDKYLNNISDRLISPLSEMISSLEYIKKGGLTKEEIENQISIVNKNSEVVSSLLNEFDSEVKKNE